MIEYKFTDKADVDLLALVARLDEYYYERFGEAALHYKQFNGLEEVLEAVVAYDNKQPVACGCLKQIDGAAAEMKRIYVAPAYRRRGIGLEVITRLERRAAERKRSAVVLETGRAMQDAVAFYFAHGYYEIENYGGFAGDDACICMKKNLGERT